MATIPEREVRRVDSDDPDRAQARPRQWRWTRGQYARLIELGILEGRRVQLIDGEIIEMAAHKPRHANAVEMLDDTLRTAFGPDFRVRVQLPIEIGRRSQPEPDGAVFIREAARALSAHPREPVLIVEVSDSSLDYDRMVKGHVYAQAGVMEYWIVNLRDRQLQIYREPCPDAEGALPVRPLHDRPGRRPRLPFVPSRCTDRSGRSTPVAAEACEADLGHEPSAFAW
jgi:Uma2 family endonuclease